jgi:hypothetical protein
MNTKVTFDLYSDRKALHIRDIYASEELINSKPVPGEYVVINSKYELIRATNITNVNHRATQTSYPLVFFTPYSQELAKFRLKKEKLGVLFGGWYEAVTQIFNPIGIKEVGQPLMVQTIKLGDRNYSGLAKHTGKHPIVGRITCLPEDNNGLLRFIQASSI